MVSDAPGSNRKQAFSVPMTRSDAQVSVGYLRIVHLYWHAVETKDLRMNRNIYY